MTRRRPVLKIVGGFLGVFALLLGGFWLWLSSVADRRWEEMKADVERRKADLAKRDGRREPLRGDPLPGNAWVDYNAALAFIAAFPKGAPTLATMVVTNATVVRADVEPVVNGLQPALDLLRRGGRQVDARLPDGPRPNLNPLKTLALWKARFDLLDGRGVEAMEVLLDEIRLMQDLNREGGPASLSFWADHDAELVFNELQIAVMKGRLSPGAMEALERELGVLERSTPSIDAAMQKFTVGMGEWAQEDPRGYLRDRSDVNWVFVYHPRLQAAAGYFDSTAQLPALAGIDGMSWADERAAWVDFDRRARRMKSHWSRSPWTTGVRRIRAQLRLLQEMLHRQRTGAWPELGDPFGLKLSHSETETHLRAWSVGPDGVDNGGKGGWKPRDGEDLLLEVPK